MQDVVNAFEAGSPIPDYLKSVVSVHREIFQSDMKALYLHGSAVQGDFRPTASDLDIFGVVLGQVSRAQCEELLDRLRHDALKVPAFGLELILCGERMVRTPVEEMPFEFALSTGEEWGTQVEMHGTTSDILVHMQLCRQSGLALAGPPAKRLLPEPSEALLRRGLLGEMFWHRDDLQDAPADQSITNAVLNAARSLYAAETGEIISKAEGGKWWLAQQPQDEVVVAALEHRSGHGTTPPSVRLAQSFVERVIARLERSL